MKMTATRSPQDNGNSWSLPSLLFIFLGRLRWYFTFVEQSLRSEFLHKPEVVNDWLRTLTWLEDSFFPVYQLFQKAAVVDGEHFHHEMAIRLPSFEQRLELSRILLQDESVAPVKRLYGLLRNLREIRAGLILWRHYLTERYGNAEIGARLGQASTFLDAVAPSAINLLQHEIAQADAEVGKGGEIAICMALRHTFFLLYYTAAVHPEEWTIELQDQVIELHQRAIDVVPIGLARDSIHARLEKLRRIDNVRFEELATASV